MLDASAEQVRGVIEEAARISTMLSEAPPVPRADLFRELVERIVIEDCSISITVRRRPLLAGVEGTLGEDQGHPMVLLAPVEFRRRGVETKLVLPDTARADKPLRLDPALIKAIARGRVWFEDLAAGAPSPSRGSPTEKA